MKVGICCGKITIALNDDDLNNLKKDTHSILVKCKGLDIKLVNEKAFKQKKEAK